MREKSTSAANVPFGIAGVSSLFSLINNHNKVSALAHRLS